MDLRIVRSITEIDPETWDGLVGDHPFSRHRFIECLENSNIPGATMAHLLMREKGKPVACTSIYSHPFELDLIAPPVVRKVSAYLRGIPGEFVKTRVLFCGLPISLGKGHFWIHPDRPEQTAKEAWEVVDETMTKRARAEKIHLIGAKEFDRRGISGLIGEAATGTGHVLCHSLHTVTLPILWKSFDHYAADLRANYRRQMISDLRACEKSGVVWKRMALCDAPAHELYQLYCNVFARAEYRLEKLSEKFFVEFAKAYGENAEAVVGFQDGRPVAMAMLLHESQATTFMFAGLDYRLVLPFGLYRNLLFQIVAAAIEHGSRSLELGQTTYKMKQRLGGLPRPLVFYLKDLNPMYHFMLKRVSPLLFPEVTHARRNVFRQNQGGAGGKRGGSSSVSEISVSGLPKRPTVDSAA